MPTEIATARPHRARCMELRSRGLRICARPLPGQGNAREATSRDTRSNAKREGGVRVRDLDWPVLCFGALLQCPYPGCALIAAIRSCTAVRFSFCPLLVC